MDNFKVIVNNVIYLTSHIYIYDDKRTAPDLLSVMIGFSWKFVYWIFDIFFLTFGFISLLNLGWEVIQDSKQWTLDIRGKS